MKFQQTVNRVMRLGCLGSHSFIDEPVRRLDRGLVRSQGHAQTQPETNNSRRLYRGVARFGA